MPQTTTFAAQVKSEPEIKIEFELTPYAVIPYVCAVICFLGLGFQFTENLSEKRIFTDFTQFLSQGGETKDNK